MTRKRLIVRILFVIAYIFWMLDLTVVATIDNKGPWEWMTIGALPCILICQAKNFYYSLYFIYLYDFAKK
jgi:hypothetical protein